MWQNSTPSVNTMICKIKLGPIKTKIQCAEKFQELSTIPWISELNDGNCGANEHFVLVEQLQYSKKTYLLTQYMLPFQSDKYFYLCKTVSIGNNTTSAVMRPMRDDVSSMS